MKFGKQLALGTYPPWRDYYISYNRLKRVINRLRFIADQQSGGGGGSGEKTTIQVVSSKTQLHQQQRPPSPNRQMDEYSPLSQTPARQPAGGRYSGTSATPGGTLSMGEGGDGTEFFPVILEEINKINKFFLGKLASLRISLEEITEKRRPESYHVHHAGGGEKNDLTTLRDIYVELAALRSYCDLNRTGFYKILKKYDKTMAETSMEVWLPLVDRQAFAKTNEPVQLMDIVTSLVSRDKLLEWERFATERHHKAEDIFPSVRFLGLSISLLIFVASLVVPMVTPSDPAASRCMSLLLLVVGLWVTEAVPYFATSLLIPALVVFLGVLKDAQDPTKPMSTEQAAQFVLNHIFNHTTMLLLGGYTISSAFSSCRLELRLASILQQWLGSSPQAFILAIMLLGLFLSMWISNHTAPILLTTIILPVVRDLPSDSRFSKALLIGLAFGCNFGGMMTPISSLQNVLAVSYLEQSGIEISFGKWILVALPFCLICILVAWVLIIVIIKPDDVPTIPVIVHDQTEVFGKKNTVVMALSLVTIVLFATSLLLKGVFGSSSFPSSSFLIRNDGFSLALPPTLTQPPQTNRRHWHHITMLPGNNVWLGHAHGSRLQLALLAHPLPRGRRQRLGQGRASVGAARVPGRRHHRHASAAQPLVGAHLHPLLRPDH